MNFDLKKNPNPRDITAVRVVYRKGEKYNHKINDPNLKHSTTPLPTRPVPKDMPNLVGVTFGNFTVIGAYGGHEVGKRPCGNKKRSKPQGWGWVVRCSCGCYEVRKTKSVRNPKNCYDCCIECKNNRYTRGDHVQIKKKIDQS